MKTHGFIEGFKRVGRMLKSDGDEIKEAPELVKPLVLEKPVVPKNKRELVKLLKDLPDSVLPLDEKRRMGAVMGIDSQKIAKILVPMEELMVLKADEYLGPLTLDRMHQTGMVHFLVRAGEKIVGVVHARDLMNLKIRDSEQAKHYLDKNLCYVRADYTIERALAAMMRRETWIAVAVGVDGKIIGALLLEDVLTYLLSRELSDDFEDDGDIKAVMARK
jgi:CBS domain containing-hemolysin-like protein